MSEANSPKQREGQLSPGASPEPQGNPDDSTLTVEGTRSSARGRAFQQRPVERNRYTLFGEVARGGLGRILRAHDSHLDRPVALKELLEPSSDARARFLTEAHITARLQHPSIIPIYEAGLWPTGEPFYAMRLVSGRSLKEVIAGTKTLAQRLALLPHVLAAAEAVAYAHSQHVIHRDLKPDNILVGEFGETVVIDWGLGKDLSRQESSPSASAAPGLDTRPKEGEALTVAGTVMGTPAYMPLEQAGGHPVDERADVYALGAILYHLLAGARPYEGDSAWAVVRQVMSGPPVPLAERQKGIPQELLTIVSKAMARAPAERYRTAREMAEDLRRFQTGQIVGAHQYTRLQLLQRFVRRYRVAVAALLLLAVVGSVSMWRIVVERDLARRKEAEAVERADALTLMQVRSAVQQDPNTIAWLGRLSPGFKRWSEVRTVAADAKARGLATLLHGHSKAISAIRFTSDGRQLLTGSDDRTVRLWDLEQGTSRVLKGHTDEVWLISLSPDGQRAVSTGKDGTLRVWELPTGGSRVFQGHEKPVVGVAFLPDGHRLVSAGRDGTLRIWDLTSGKATRVFRVEGSLFSRMVLSPDGRQVVTSTVNEPVVRVWDVERGKPLMLAGHQQPVRAVAFSPDGALIATGSDDQTVRVWDPRTGEGRVLGEQLGTIQALVFSPDGRTLAASGSGLEIRLWDLSTGLRRELSGHEGKVEVLAFSPDGKWLASGGHDRSVRLWEPSTGQSRVLGGLGGTVHQFAFSRDGRQLAVGGVDALVRLFPVTEPGGRVLEAPNGFRYDGLHPSPEGGRLAMGGTDGTVRVWALPTGAPSTLAGHEGKVVVRFSPDGRYLVSGDEQGSLRLWDAEGRLLRVLEGRGHPITVMAYSPEGGQVAFATYENEVHLWNPTTGQVRMLQSHAERQVEDLGITALEFSPDGRHLASASELAPSVSLWEVATGKKHTLRGHEEGIGSLAFSPEGHELATGSMDHTVRFWSLDGVERRRIDLGGNGVSLLRFSPDGAALFTVGAQESLIGVWDARTGAARGTLTGHDGDVNSIAISTDGKRLASASEDQTVRLWDLESRTSRVLRGHTGPVTNVAFSPDGQQVFSRGADDTIRRWPDELPSTPEALRAWLETVEGPPSEADEVHR
jgi:WD40 repeat protein